MSARDAIQRPRVAKKLLLARALRGVVDGYVAVLLPAYLLALGFDAWHVGLLSTATLLGSALATLAVGAFGHRAHPRALLLAASALMAATGLAFASLSDFWPLLLVAFVGTLNPGGGDVSVFLPLEHARLANAAEGNARTTLFARYSLAGALAGSLGALAAVLPETMAEQGVEALSTMRAMFVAYALAGVAVALLYWRLPRAEPGLPAPPAPLGVSRPRVLKLAMLFSVDAFAGGLLVQSLLALWLFERFQLSLGQAGTFFFWTGLFAAGSQLAAPWVARRIGLLNTMVFTHIPSSLALIAAALSPRLEVALGFLLLRSALSQMDVPTRSAFVMAMVTPPERSAAASFTAVPRSLAAAIGPTLGAAMFANGMLAAPLLACGGLKIAYDLALLAMFRKMTPPPD